MIKLISIVLDIALHLIKEITGGMLDFIESLIQPARKTEFTADFAPVSSILKHTNRGFCLSGRHSLSIQESYRNSIILGNTGSGKTSSIIVNTILSMAKSGSSLIINDPSHELRMLTSGALRKYNYEIKILDYSSLKSECFNPLSKCESISDINKLSSLIIRNTLGEGKDPFWNKSAESLLSLFTRHLIKYEDHKYRTLYNLVHLINAFTGNPDKIDKLIVKSGDERILAEYKAFVAMSDRMLSSITATAKSALTLFSDEIVAKITSADTIKFKQLRDEKVAIYINNSIPNMTYFAPLTALFFQQLLDSILSRIPSKSENPIFLLIDEASSFYLPQLSVTVSNIRKYMAGIMIVIQDKNALEHIYGFNESRNIITNCVARSYLPGQPLDSCKMLEVTLGRFEYEDEKGIKHTRPLLTVDEIRMTEKAIILISNKPPIHTKLHPFYKSRKLRKLTELPPHEPGNVLPFDIPPLIKLGDAT